MLSLLSLGFSSPLNQVSSLELVRSLTLFEVNAIHNISMNQFLIKVTCPGSGWGSPGALRSRWKWLRRQAV